MKEQLVFIGKIAIASLVLSEIVKYGGGALPIEGNNTTALVIVLLPSLVLGIIFSWRMQKQ